MHPVNSVVVTQSGEFAISADDTIKVWHLQTGKVVASFSVETSVYSCAVAADGLTIVGFAYSNTVKKTVVKSTATQSSNSNQNQSNSSSQPNNYQPNYNPPINQNANQLPINGNPNIKKITDQPKRNSKLLTKSISKLPSDKKP